jgi:carboxylesterase type B
MIMFYIYGGQLRFDSNSVLTYDGTSFAAIHDVIIVVPNYRSKCKLKICLVIVSNASFSSIRLPGGSGLPLAHRNLGYLGQHLALDWVHRNIAASGGNPEKITVFGESAGAASVDELLATMHDHPPFPELISRKAARQVSTSITITTLHQHSMGLFELLTVLLQQTLLLASEVDVLTVKFIEEHLALEFKIVSDNVTQLEFPERARQAGTIARVLVLTSTTPKKGDYSWWAKTIPKPF